MHTIHVTMKAATPTAPGGKVLVAWHYNDELIYVDVGCGLPPFDDFDTFAYKVEKRLGHADFYHKTTILYASAISCESLSDAKAHKAAADLLISVLAPVGAKRKAKRPVDVEVHLDGDWPTWLPAQVSSGAVAEPQEDINAFMVERCRGQALPRALEVLLAEHAEDGTSYLLDPSTFEMDLGSEVDQDDERIVWFASGAGGFRLGFWLGDGDPVSSAPLILGDGEGGTRSVGRSIEEFIVLFASYDGPARLASAREWLAANGLSARTPEEVSSDLPKVG